MDICLRSDSVQSCQSGLSCIVHVQRFNSALSSLILLKLKLNHCLQGRLDLGDLVENDLPGR